MNFYKLWTFSSVKFFQKSKFKASKTVRLPRSVDNCILIFEYFQMQIFSVSANIRCLPPLSWIFRQGRAWKLFAFFNLKLQILFEIIWWIFNYSASAAPFSFPKNFIFFRTNFKKCLYPVVKLCIFYLNEWKLFFKNVIYSLKM